MIGDCLYHVSVVLIDGVTNQNKPRSPLRTLPALFTHHCNLLFWLIPQDGYTPLHLAALRGHVDPVRLLVEVGASCNTAEKVFEDILIELDNQTTTVGNILLTF